MAVVRTDFRCSCHRSYFKIIKTNKNFKYNIEEKVDEKENGIAQKIEDYYQQEQDEQEERIIRQYSQKKTQEI